jgi:hypothetical protein
MIRYTLIVQQYFIKTQSLLYSYNIYIRLYMTSIDLALHTL